MLTFQQIIYQLTQFWADQGCVTKQGYDLEVGAGTFNPSTFLRCLGPEPFNTVYVEPSRRPQDGRFAENPNRMQLFHQLQVIMKPSPKKIQKLYMQSLEILGFQLKQHDIRFVHDDWESPTLGAWGLGWEVWLDGMEVTQFTYFQSVANHPLNPISVELTYGLERLCMALQKKENFFEMQWNETLKYGDIFHQNEIEWSHYNFYHASTTMWLTHFDDFEKEAKKLVSLKLPIPAYDFVIKASHAFNMLEARGVLSVTERVGYITRVREIAKMVATAYLESRKNLGFPLLKSKPLEPSTSSLPPQTENPFASHEKKDFLLEIGSEELPATFVPLGCSDLKEALKKFINNHHLSFKKIEVFGTPRRLSIYIKDLSCGVEASKIEKKGPPISVAFNSKGEATKQGEGFFKSIQLKTTPSLDLIRNHKVPNLSIKIFKEKEYLLCELEKKTCFTFSLLSEALPKLIMHLNFPKKMHWVDTKTSYARPIRWVVALLGKEVIPFEIAGIHSGKTSYGHRQMHPNPIEIEESSTYLSQLKEGFVIADIDERKNFILKQLAKIEAKTETKAVQKENVLDEVLFLSEFPLLFHSSFETHFLKIPKEILICEMVKHQRYFPLSKENGQLSHFFVITSDNHPNSLIEMGNKHVLSARLSDGVFLYEQDLQSSLDEFANALEAMIFQKDLGSLANKTQRIASLGITLCQMLNLGNEKKIKRAARLAKADLATELVQEFPELQGVIGKYYALHQNEEKEIAYAIEEHWQPKSEGDQLPQSATGIILSLADKLDNLICYLSIGLKPTSSSDPYALRRQTIGIIKILIENKLSLNLKIFFEATSFPSVKKESKKVLIEKLLQFITSRCQGVFQDYGFKKDEVEASLQGICLDPFDQFLKTKALHAFRKQKEFKPLFEVYKRAKGQSENQTQISVQPSLLKEKAEKDLYQLLEKIHLPFKTHLKNRDYKEAFALLTQFQQPLAFLFDTVKILSDEKALRQNRLALLQEVLSYYKRVIDFSKIQVL